MQRGRPLDHSDQPPKRWATSLRAALVIAGLLACHGCTSFGDYLHNGLKVGPDYLRPAVPLETDWIDTDDARLKDDTPDLSRWWTIFQDPALDGLITRAYEQNLTLREAGFRILQARAQLGIVVGRFFPQDQAMFGSYSRNAVSKANANTSFLPDKFFDQWNGGFSLAWELDFWGRYRRAIESADADLDASVENFDAVLVTLLGDVASTYVQMRMFEAELALVYGNVKLQQQTLDFARARFRGGNASELDVDQAQSNLAQTEALVPQFEILHRQANNALCVLLGMPPEELQELIGANDIPVAPVDVSAGIPAQLLTQRPDVRRAERLVAAQSAQVGVATSELYPHISINGTIGVSAQSPGNLFTSPALQGVASPGFRWNVLNYGRLLNNIRLQDAKLQELVVNYQNTVLNAQREVEDGLVRFLKSQTRAKSLATSVVASQRAVEISLAQYRGGTTDFNRVALLQQNLVQQQDLQAQARAAISLGLIEVYRALGGGWEIRFAPPGSLPPLPELPAGSVPPLVPEAVPVEEPTDLPPPATLPSPATLPTPAARATPVTPAVPTNSAVPTAYSTPTNPAGRANAVGRLPAMTPMTGGPMPAAPISYVSPGPYVRPAPFDGPALAGAPAPPGVVQPAPQSTTALVASWPDSTVTPGSTVAEPLRVAPASAVSLPPTTQLPTNHSPNNSPVNRPGFLTDSVRRAYQP